MYKGIFIYFRDKIKFKGSQRSGQIATFIMLFIAVVALLAAVVINIAKVSERRVSVVNAASGSVLQLASSLGSYSHMLSCKYIRCRTQKCKFSFLSIFKIILTIIAIVLIPFTAGQSMWLLTIALAIVAVSGAVSIGIEYAVTDPKMLESMNRAFRELAPKVQISESAIRYAFSNTVDDRAKVADMHDMDMDGLTGLRPDGTPNDTMSRFSYRYQQRLLWLGDNGPASDGTYNRYQSQLNRLIADFIPYLSSFRQATLDMSAYLGVFPRYQQQPPAPDFNRPERIDSLYSLFAYLQEREYPYLSGDYRYYRNVSRLELYRLSYHLYRGNIINVWTRGLFPCNDEDEWDEDRDDPCLHNQVNDELDTFKDELDYFNEFSNEILTLSGQEQMVAFFEWYPELYDAEETDTFYNTLWASTADNPRSEKLVERSWRRLMDSWISRLTQVETDLRTRPRGRWWWGGRDWRAWQLYYKVQQARSRLENFRNKITVFHDAIIRMRDAYIALENVPHRPGDEDFLLFSRGAPTYVWHDSLGRHSVRVEVSSFQLPYLKSYKKGFCCKKCVKLKKGSGTVWIKVTRRDDPTDANLGSGTLLWRFRYPTITYTASASFNHTANPPRFLGITRND